MAMQPMDDQSLSAMTGQDGLTIGVQANIQFDQMNPYNYQIRSDQSLSHVRLFATP